MKLPISANSVLLLCTALLSTFCLVLSFENDEDHQIGSPFRYQEVLDESLGSGLNDKLALREFLDAYRDGESMFKRAPAAGFYGMRGKKVPGQNFYGMRGKKGPSGFLGMRGKKMDQKYGGGYLLGGDSESPLDVLEDMWASKVYQQGSLENQDGGAFLGSGGRVGGGGPSKLSSEQQLGPSDNSMADHRDIANKRAPANGFMGLRGKRNSNLKVTGSSNSH